MKRILFLLLNIHYIFCLQAQDLVEVTYIANSGFLISGKSKKIIIDGIFTDSYGKYHAPLTETIEKERNALQPFKNLNLILISHSHADHINSEYVAEHMMKDTGAVLLGTSQVKELFNSNVNFNSIKDRLFVFNPATIIRKDTSIQDIKISAISMIHPNDNTMQDLGYVFKIDSIKFFHPGDATDNTSDFYKTAGLANDSIDVALLPRWYFDSENGDKGVEIINYIKPKVIIITHVNLDKYDYYKNAVKDLQGLPPVYFMEKQMQKFQFSKKNGSLNILGRNNVIINELQASNTSVIKDDAGDYDDWIELHNPNTYSVNIGGLVLKDNVDTWQIPLNNPQTILLPESFFLLWADDEEQEGPFHTNFKLSATNGEFLGLYDSDSLTVIDTMTFPPLADNFSYGKCSGFLKILSEASPKKENVCVIDFLGKENTSEKPVIYPNPADRNVSILFNSKVQEGIIELYNLQGQRLISKIITNFNSADIKLTGLAKGMYLIRITADERVFEGSFCKQ